MVSFPCAIYDYESATGPATVVVANASSPALATLLTGDLTALSRRVAVPQQVIDLAPLPARDPKRLSVFYLAFAWVFGGYIAAVALNAIRSDQRFRHTDAAIRTAGLLVFATLGGGVTSAIAVFGTHSFAEHAYEQLVGLGMLTSFAVAMSSSALISTFGSLGTALVITLFVILGTPVSDGATPIEMTGAGPWH